MKWILGCVFLLISSIAISAQAARFSATADARQIVQNSYVQVTFRLENGEGSDFRPPAFTDFEVISGPSQGMRRTIVNGVTTQEITIGFTLQPKRTGNLTIGSASMVVDGQTFRTAPIEVKVVKAAAGAATGPQAFLRAEISDSVAYIGQQLVLDYKLYTTQQVESYNILREPTYPGFFSQGVRRFDNRLMREVIDGVQYVTKIIRRVVLYPQQSGTLKIEPMNAQLGISEENKNSGNIFFSRRIRRVPARTNDVIVQVKPLPEPKPADFDGAIGRYELQTAVDRTSLSTDDALTMRVIVRGTGDSKRVLPPKLDLGDAFEVYDPKTVRDETYEMTTELTSEKEFVYPITPLQPGEYRIQPKYTYFNVDSADYVTAYSRMYIIDVTQGKLAPGAARVPTFDSLATEGMRDFRPLTLRRPSRTHLLGNALFWLLIAIPFITLLVFWWLRRQRLAEAGLDPAVRRRRDARKQALQRLETADQLRQAGDSRAFYNELSRAMLGYVSDKLRIPPAELSKANVSRRLRELNVSESNVDRFATMLGTAEMALYAGKDNAASMEKVYQDAVDLLGDIESAA